LLRNALELLLRSVLELLLRSALELLLRNALELLLRNALEAYARLADYSGCLRVCLLPSRPRAPAAVALAGDARDLDAAEEESQHSLYPQERHFLHPSS
jgi:hypothetical protein